MDSEQNKTIYIFMPHWTMHPLIAADGHTDTKIDALGSMQKNRKKHICVFAQFLGG